MDILTQVYIYAIIISRNDISRNDVIQVKGFLKNMGNSNTALTETTFYILLSLQTPSHGYAIMQNIKTITNERVRMGAGTLYGALSALNDKGFIKECECKDPTKREYVITEHGKAALKKEIDRLFELTYNAEKYFKGE